VVSLNYPPPKGSLDPCHHKLSVGTRLRRIFNPSQHNTTALTFRSYGPILRFDHHAGQGKERKPCLDAGRGIYYAADRLSCCIVEVFGGWGKIADPFTVIADYHLASPILTRDLEVLDLRGTSAMKAVTKSAIAKTRDRRLSQAWARYFYENPEAYAEVDGLLYYNAHNDEEALVLFERAQDALECTPDRVFSLNDVHLRTHVLRIFADHGLI
jgi:hypothetical protein